MKVGFFAPSYKRPEKSMTQKKFPFVKLVVSESEYEEYKKNGNDVVSCPDEVQGNLCRVRNYILDFYEDYYDCIVLMDDDIHHIHEWEGQKKVPIEGEDWRELCEVAAIMCKESGVYFWGVNSNNDKGSYREHTPISFSSYIAGPIQGFMTGGGLRYDENLPLKEDYDMTLQQLVKHGYVLRLNFVLLSVKQSEQEGGCATYRNLEREKEQFMRLRRKWGSKLVRYDDKSLAVFDYNPILKLPY